jgi:hypothetical protein
LEIAGGIPVAQYVHDIVEANGSVFPRRDVHTSVGHI